MQCKYKKTPNSIHNGSIIAVLCCNYCSYFYSIQHWINIIIRIFFQKTFSFCKLFPACRFLSFSFNPLVHRIGDYRRSYCKNPRWLGTISNHILEVWGDIQSVRWSLTIPDLPRCCKNHFLIYCKNLDCSYRWRSGIFVIDDN